MLKNKTEIVNIIKTKSRLTCLINTTRKVEKKISPFFILHVKCFSKEKIGSSYKLKWYIIVVT